MENPQKLNIKNTFDLLEYLKPLFTYIASNIKVFKEDFIKNHANNCVNYQGYGFMFEITLTTNILFNPICYVGMQYGYINKKEFSFDGLLNADEIKNYIKKEITKENLTFMFNTKTIPFEVRVIILRSDEDARIFEN